MDHSESEKVLEALSQLQEGQSINLVLSGGGVKGVAHIALLEYLSDKGIEIKAISGSSAGALVGALYCSGQSPADILDFFKDTPIFRYSWLNPIKAGIFDSMKYAAVINKYVKEEFDDLDIPLHIAATNIEKNKAVYFSKGHLADPLLASCAVPAVFTPVEIDGELYSDGGITDNFPVHPFSEIELYCLGSCVCRPDAKSKNELNSILKVSQHANNLLLYSANTYKFELTDLTILFPTGRYGTFDTKSIDAIYDSARNFLDLL